MIPLTGTESSFIQHEFNPQNEMLPASPVYANEIAEEVYMKVTQTSYSDLVKGFSDLGPKLYATPGNDDARDWIIDKLSSLTNNKVVGQVVGAFENVVGRLKGTAGSSGPVVMVGAHYDTIDISAGANDDGSGVATALELARVLSQYSWPLDIYFGFWNREESGLHGSRDFANNFSDSGIDMLIYYNIDMLLVPSVSVSLDRRVYMAYLSEFGAKYQDSQFWAELTRAVGNNYDSAITNPIPSSDFASWDYSDHRPFQEAGYKGVIFAHETGGNRDVAYHTENDVWSNPLYRYDVGAAATASIGAALAFSLSRIENQPFYERYQFTLSAGSSQTILIPMSLKTEIGVTSTVSGGGSIRARIISPFGQEIGSEILGNANGQSSLRFAENTSFFGLHGVEITNVESRTTTFEVVIDYDTDIEGDDIPDSTQEWYSNYQDDSDDDGIGDDDEDDMGPDPMNSDRDGDNLSDYEERYIYGTAISNNDTDGDLMPDGWEVQMGLNPLLKDGNRDPDFDGLLNIDEYRHGTLYNNSDTDSDLMLDGWEVLHGLNPLIDDANQDPDGDTLSNLYEYRAGYDPMVYDGPMASVIPITFGTVVVLIAAIGWYARSRFKGRA